MKKVYNSLEDALKSLYIDNWNKCQISKEFNHYEKRVMFIVEWRY